LEWLLPLNSVTPPMFLYTSPDWTRVVTALQKQLAALDDWLGRDYLEDPASLRARVEEAHPGQQRFPGAFDDEPAPRPCERLHASVRGANVALVCHN
jgi:hypothetical protein